jgi:glycosyltransferase involved in cell wall biosynthesis
MKILIANYRYFISGGPERYMFNVANALIEKGHAAIPFSIQYERNQPSPYRQYFVQPLGGEGEIYFREQKLTLKTIWRTLSRLFYAPDVEQAVMRLVKDTKPEIAYVLHYLRKLSPSLLVGLKRAGLPIVVRLSDYAMLCPQAHFLRENTLCELCINGNLLPSVRYRCVQGSLAASSLNALATGYHRSRGYFNLVNVFVTTTRFMYQKMIAAGYPEERLCHIPTFVDSLVFHPTNENSKGNYIAYAGRLEHLKGVHILIDAIALLQENPLGVKLKVKIVGTGNEQYIALLKQQVQRLGLGSVIEFLGEIKTEELVPLLNRAVLTVVPSLWYENLPNAILESYACGTPVLASNLGSLVECVKEGQTGYLFKAGDAKHLADRLAFCLGQPGKLIEMGRNARETAETIYSQNQHLEKLEKLFGELVSASHKNREF